MSEAIAASLITGICSLVGVIISNLVAGKKTETAIKVNQAVMDARLNELTREVREHNNFARRMPVVEEQVKVINHRLADLERGEK